MSKKDSKHIKLSTQLENLGKHNDFLPETVRDVFIENSDLDLNDKALWGIQCDNSPSLRNVSLSAKMDILEEGHKILNPEPTKTALTMDDVIGVSKTQVKPNAKAASGNKSLKNSIGDKVYAYSYIIVMAV